MTKHEEKFCPRCKAIFECKVGSVALCQCRGVSLNDAQLRFIRQHFNDCLCAKCMTEMRKDYNIQQFKNRIKKIIGWR
jgi:Cysteine-rich CWC